MNCWTVLGLPSSADTRSIKRQYATLLKQTRPDEDPVGFQRLREAYEQALDWSRRHEDAAAPWDAAPVSISEATQVLNAPAATEIPLQIELFDAIESARNRAQARATELLQGAKASELDLLFEKAVASDCQQAFEEQLLPLSLAPSPNARDFAAWGLKQFQWLTPWQRTDLPAGALQLLLQQSMYAAETRLADALAQEDAEGFLATLNMLIQSTWLQALERREWLNQSVARLLFEADYWSESLLSKVCDACGWLEGAPGPEPYWSRLLERQQEQAFLGEKRLLFASGQTSPASRAAKLMFKTMTPDQRTQLAYHFTKADWAACQRLSEQLKHRYPRLLKEVPGSDPYFWRALQRPEQAWPTYIAIMAGSAVASIDKYWLKGGGLINTGISVLFWISMFSLFSVYLRKGWGPVADLLSRQDVWLSNRFARWLSVRRPTPLLLRESTPCLIIAGAFYALFGLGAALAFLVTLVVQGGLYRFEGFVVQMAQTRSLLFASPQRTWLTIKIWIFVAGISLAAITASTGAAPTLKNQGLQPWAERSCAHLILRNDDCRIPATQQQWFGSPTLPKWPQSHAK